METDAKKEETKKEEFIEPITAEIFKDLTKRIEAILKLSKSKLEASKPSLLLKPKDVEVLTEEYKTLFTEQEEFIKKENTYPFIFDCLNFIHYVKSKDEKPKSKQLDQDKLSALYSSLTEKGTLVILGDYHILKQLPSSLVKTFGDNFLTKLFLKLYIVSKSPMLSVMFIQKMSVSEKPIDILNEKLLSYEIYEDLSITKPISYTISCMGKSLTYIYEMFRVRLYLQNLHPGQVFPIPIKEAMYSDNIECNLTIIDSNDQTLIEKKNCVAVIVGRGFINEFINLSQQGFLALCEQVKAARIILIRPAPFNFDDVYEIKRKMNSYIILFTYKDCVNTDSIPLMLMNENSDNQMLEKIDDFIIKDSSDKLQKNNVRQLVYITNPNEPLAQIKLTLTSKARAKQEKSYITLKTEDKYANKGLVLTFDDKVICNYYDRTVLCGLLFTDLEKFPQENLNVLILGAGIGTISYYMNKILLGKVNIDNVEKNQKITKYGKLYFCTNDYQNKKSNIKWHFEDAKKFIKESRRENYYDYVILDIKSFDIEQGISPSKDFFDSELVKKLSAMMKANAMYVLNMMSRSYRTYYENLVQLEKEFNHIFLLKNTEDLNKIHFCFKKKNNDEFYKSLYEKNSEKLAKKENADASLIQTELKKQDQSDSKEDHQKILARVIESSSFKEMLLSKTK